MTNLFAEIDALPRRQQIVLIGYILRQAKPSISEIAEATTAEDQSVRGWLGIRKPKVGHTVDIQPSVTHSSEGTI